jgi:hypothetical protein
MSGMMDRREFIRSVTRYTLAGGLLAGSGLLVWGISPDPNCRKPFECDDCDLFRNCTLPKASAFADSANRRTAGSAFREASNG